MEESNEQRNEFRKRRNEKVKLFQKEVVKPLLKNAKRLSIFSMGIPGNHFGSATLSLHSTNKNFYESQYYYDRDLVFIHYTSLKNAINIIREKGIRMYDLNNMNDELELNHTVNNILLEKDEYLISRLKEALFSFSMCEFSIEQEKRSINQWENYGHKGNGVGIVFSFSKENQKKWNYQYLSQVYYDEKEMKGLKTFIQDHKNFEERECFKINQVFEELLLISSCFHKNGSFKNENEVRFLKYKNKQPYNEHESLDVHIDLGKDYQKAYYTTLCLDSNKHEEYIQRNNFSEREKKIIRNLDPKVKIEKIILGYNYNKLNVFDIGSLINELSKQKLGYEIDVSITEVRPK